VIQPTTPPLAAAPPHKNDYAHDEDATHKDGSKILNFNGKILIKSDVICAARATNWSSRPVLLLTAAAAAEQEINTKEH